MKTLLICDNKDEWENFRKLFAVHFKKIELVCVIDGKSAVDYLSFEGPFSFILIDTAMKNEVPSDLARKLIEIAGERPVVFYGNPALIKDRVDEDLIVTSEINYILYSPINIDEFKEVVQNAIAWAQEEEFEKSIEEINKDDLLPMKLRNFYLFDEIAYDVFVELTATKYIKVISANKKYIHKDINSYAKKGIKHLYLKKDEYLKFLEEGIDKLLIFYSTAKKMKPSVAIGNQIRATLLIHQYVRTVGVTEKLIKLCDEAITCTKNVILECKNFKNILSLFPKTQADLAEQSIMTLYLAELMLTSLGWASETSRKKMGLASLLYDSMLSNDDLSKITSLEDPELEKFSEEEQTEFRNHPVKAADMARNFQGYPEVDFIVSQHHERPRGDGFPHGIANNKLTAHSCIFILANNFILKFVAEGKDPSMIVDIFREMKTIYNIGNFKDPVSSLQRAISL